MKNKQKDVSENRDEKERIFIMENKEIALQLTAAAIAGGVIEFKTGGVGSYTERDNIKKIVKVYINMLNEVNKNASKFSDE